MTLCFLSEPVRLVGGASRCAGTLEVRRGEWRPVAMDIWNLKDAAAVCGQMNCGSAVSVGNTQSSSRRSVWWMESHCVQAGYALKECASADRSSSTLDITCSDLLVQPIISASFSSNDGQVRQQESSWVLKGSSFTISCSIHPQYPGGSFQLTFTSSNTTNNYTQPAVNHSAHFLFPAAEPAHQGTYSCVYHVFVFSHNFSSESRQLSLTVSDPTVFVIRLLLLLLSLLLFISAVCFSHKVHKLQPLCFKPTEAESG
ncbi:deleted in malignant brain tumors 1 protein-like [Neolamprologus brichardi]|uniref:deleted in malignant brain tumors 1 protein-like n=1 Tax=Neolamprologus brichardi TaxID=32507 RepID=UPI001643782A|nr:deleted in malignant brain tumors 1 protein-like [Neolamprologus brichardi]